MKEASELKSLQTQLSDKRKELDKFKKIVSKIETDISNIKNQISKLTGFEPIVTEHALLRYIERIEGIDLKVISDKILKGRVEMIKAIENGKIKTDRYEIVIKNRCVVSILTKK